VDSNNDVLAASHNTVEGRRDATCHAEINCIREASQVLGNWRLTGCTLISTIRPCSMCLRVSEAARLSNIIYGAESALDENKLASPTNIEMHGPVSGFEQTCADMMKKFFNDLRLSSKV
jgi:tRNA(adenine34) deaminase